MFKVINKLTKEMHTVYDIRVNDDKILFLIYDKFYGWHWYDADRYKPIELTNNS
jgi:hypothetical protein